MLTRSSISDALLALPTAALSLSSFLRRGGEEEVGWTGPFTPADYRAFANVIRLYFGVRELPIAIKDGELTVNGPRGRDSEHLGPLAELCHRHAHERWPELIAEHFQARFGGQPPAPPAARPPARLAPPVRQAPRRPLPRAAPPPPRDGDWAAFRGMVEECFRRYGFSATVDANGVVARDGDGQERRYEARGLDQGPRELPRGEWARFVDGAFGEPLRALRGREALAGRGFDEVRELLAVQLFEEMWLSVATCRDTVFTRELPGLLSALVCRLPQATFRVSAETVEEWGLGSEEVMAAALANLRQLRPRMERFAVAPGVEGMRFETRGPFAAAQALTLADYPECGGAGGAFVGVPRRQLLLVCPLRPMATAPRAYVAAAKGLIGRIRQSEWEGHTPLTARLYWYREGGFAELPYAAQAGRDEPAIEFTPGEDLAAALEGLVGGEGKEKDPCPSA